MAMIRTDLAMEAHARWKASAGDTSKLRGVIAREETLEGFPLTNVEIVDNNGAEALGKPQGTYLTLDISEYWKHKANAFCRAAEAIAKVLEPITPKTGAVFIAGLGNPDMTPDALGPQCLSHLLITRHLKQILPDFRETAALSGGVLGTTGLEAAEWVRGAAEHIQPKAVIVIDALAAGELKRVCNSIQISNTGLIPGSGVGNHRIALNRENLGVPVISIGVPTVVEIETIIRDITENPTFQTEKGFFVTPDSIDDKIKHLAKILGYGISLALHPNLSMKDLNILLS